MCILTEQPSPPGPYYNYRESESKTSSSSSTSIKSPSSAPFSFAFPCCVFHIFTRKSASLICSIVLSSLTLINRGNLRLRPLELWTRPMAATDTGLRVTLSDSGSELIEQSKKPPYSAPRISQTSLGLKKTSGVKPWCEYVLVKYIFTDEKAPYLPCPRPKDCAGNTFPNSLSSVLS